MFDHYYVKRVYKSLCYKYDTKLRYLRYIMNMYILYTSGLLLQSLQIQKLIFGNFFGCSENLQQL